MRARIKSDELVNQDCKSYKWINCKYFGNVLYIHFDLHSFLSGVTRSYSTSAIDLQKPEKTLSVLGWNTIDKWKSRQDLLPPKSILREQGIFSTLYNSRSTENDYFLFVS